MSSCTPQEAECKALLAAFDALWAEHEAMAPGEFNDDGTYKIGINQVRRRGMLGRRAPSVEGRAAAECARHISESESSRVRAAPSVPP